MFLYHGDGTFDRTQRGRFFLCPGKSGIVRAETIPIIAMTANVFREDVEKCMEAGMNGHIGKPVNMDDILGQLRQYIKL